MSGLSSEVWFPVLSVLLGFAGKGVLDYFTDSRRAKAEAAARRDARKDAASLRKIAFQRDTLIELQETLAELGRAAASANVADSLAHRASGTWGRNMLEEPLNEDLRRYQSRVMLLASRVADDDVRGRVVRFRLAVTQVLMARGEEESDAALLGLVNTGNPLQEKIGTALRRLDEREADIVG